MSLVIGGGHKLKPQFDAHIHFKFSVQSSTQANTLALASPTTSHTAELYSQLPYF